MDKKKLIIFGFVIVILVTVMGYYQYSKSNKDVFYANGTPDGDSVDGDSKGQNNTNQDAEIDYENDSSIDDQSKVLDGSDFRVTLWFTEIDSKMNTTIQVELNQLKKQNNKTDKIIEAEASSNPYQEIKTITSYSGQKSQLASILFVGADVELEKLIPDQKREVMIIKSTEWLNDGQGGLGMYAIYVVEDTNLKEVLSVVTNRDSEINLSADVSVTKDSSNYPIINYKYKSDSGSGEIKFIWKNNKFVDESGKYIEIEKKYRP